MSDRKILSLAIHLATASALVVAVMTSPIGSLRTTPVSPRTACLRRNFALPPDHPARLLAAATTHSAPMKAVCTAKTTGRTAPAFRHLATTPPRTPFFRTTRGPAGEDVVRATHALRC
jgi:hypothetical protein